MAQMVKNLPAIQEMQVQSLCWEDLLEKEMVTYSSILAWRMPWTESGGLQSIGLQTVRHSQAAKTHTLGSIRMEPSRTRTVSLQKEPQKENETFLLSVK